MTDEQTDLKGYVHSVETGGTVDGPGVRYVVFLSGCPLRCQYCHNPDMMKKKHGTEHTVGEIFHDIQSYAKFMMKAKGGVTISGGEPLVQPDFTGELLRRCKDIGMHTALDTSGFLGSRATDEMLDNTDLVLLDIKSAIACTYKETTGVELQPTLDFAKRLDARGNAMWIRFVLVPGLTDAPENIEALALFLKDMKHVERVDILPFHKMGEYKWQNLGMEYKLKNAEEPGNADIEAARAIFEKHGIKVH